MNEISLKNDYYNVELIIKNGIAIFNFNNQLFSKVDITNITPNGYQPYSSNHKPDLKEWNLIKILAAIITIKNDLWWQKQSNFNKRSSYGLKHDIEKQWFYQEVTEELGTKYYHLGNGELIVAMLLLGFKMKEPESINVFFNLEKNYPLKESVYFRT